MASSQSEQFRARAEDCEVKAKAADDAEVRRMYRDMAAHFHQMAREQDDELGDLEHYRIRAKETKAAAGQEKDLAVKRTMLTIAAEYDRLAERAEDRNPGNAPRE